MKARVSFFFSVWMAVWMSLAPVGGALAAQRPDVDNGGNQVQNSAVIIRRETVNIPAASFRPANGSNDYQNHGRYFIQYDAASDTGDYYAPVNLPQNVIVTKMTFYFRDNTTDNGVMRLFRTAMNGTGVQMAVIDTSGSWASPSYGSNSTTTINGEEIDNKTNAYYLRWELPDSTTGANASMVWGCGVIIEYETTPAMSALPYSYSITGAAFTPYEDGYGYNIGGSVLQHSSGPGSSTTNGWYQGRLHLPDGASVKKMVFYYNLNSNYQGVARLQRTHLGQGNYTEMATVYTGVGATGVTSNYDDSIEDDVIDNSQYTYWVIVDIPALNKGNSNIAVYGVRIEYNPAMSYYKSGIMSISAGSFVPYEDGYDYQNHARYMFHFSGPSGAASRGWYLAPVQLPDGAMITKITTHWYDNKDDADGLGLLQRSTLGLGNFIQLATTDSSGGSPYVYFGKSATEITNPVVDNKHYTYWVTVDLPLSTGSSHPGVGDVAFCGATIEYVYFKSFVPSVLLDTP